MSRLLQNAINSIQMGIEDYQANDPRRPASAVRNFYSGVLLLGKQCLVNAAPKADMMEVLAHRFVPYLDGNGRVIHRPHGHRTIDFLELEQRFSAFKLPWPKGDIKSLQKLRNDLEHFHSTSPKERIRQVISDCFPTVEGFFDQLQIDPSDALGVSWEIMLKEESFFTKLKNECDGSLAKLPWYDLLESKIHYECSRCGSSLVYQIDGENADPTSIEGRCKACGENFTADEFIKIIVQGEYGADDYISVKDGSEPVINDCPECVSSSYICNGEISICFTCDSAISGKCGLCNVDLSVRNLSVNNENLCDYCDYVMSKDD